MRTELNIYSTSGTVFITSGTIDLYDDIPISLNYSIADIKEPQKRDSDYSKTITAPGTNNNNNLFSHIYEIGVDRLYNPNKKIEARILYNGIQVMKGWMRLAKIRTLKNQKIEYDLEVKGRLDDLFTTLVDKKLTDLSWTDLNHTYSRSNQIASWSAPVGSNYVYPFIDYGYSLNSINYDVNNFFPAVYFKEVLDRIFRYAGFQYSSTFLTSTFFKSLIMPFTSDRLRLTAAQVEARQFKASVLTSDFSYTILTSPSYGSNTANEYIGILFNDDSTPNNSDVGNNYGVGSGIYTVPANGYYYFTTNLSLDGTATPNIPNQYILNQILVYPRIIKNATAIAYGSGFLIHPNESCTTTYSTVQTSSTFTNCYVQWQGFLNAGDQIYVQLEMKLLGSICNQAAVDVTYAVRAKVNSYFYGKVEPEIKDGDTVTFSNTLPQEMKIVDFLVSIIKKFNLYFEYDKDIPNKIYIEPRNDFYNSTIQDWSGKLDAGQEPEIIPMGALNAKRYRFTYKKDTDSLNTLYNNIYGEIYGERYKDVDNDFLRNTETLELVFSPTPLFSSPASDRVYPAIINIDSNNQIVHNKINNPRMLYYGGLKNCNTWIYNSLGSITFLTQYPYCGHLDDPEAPTVDLNFGVPREVYYIPAWNANYTNNNSYNKYWKQFIDEITDYNSSIVTAWFWLSPSDILQVDFRNVYRFMNQHFRLNKIYDYNPSTLSLTKCEFVKLKTGIPFDDGTVDEKVINGASDDVFSTGERLPKIPNTTSRGNNVASLLQNNTQQVYGINNYVAASSTQVLINGSYNIVGELAQNINIQTSSGIIVVGGLVNVSVLNSSGITVTESNVIYENNIKISSQPAPNAGAFNPILSNLTNITTSSTTKSSTYMRVGNTVAADYSVNVTPTSTLTQCRLRVSLPPNIEANPSASPSGIGMFDENTTINNSGAVVKAFDSTSVDVFFTPVATTSHILNFHVSYRTTSTS